MLLGRASNLDMQLARHTHISEVSAYEATSLIHQK